MIRSVLRLLPALAFVACSGGGSADAPPPAGGGDPAKATGDQTRDTLVVAYQSDIGYLNPVLYETAADSNVLAAITFPLYWPDFDCSIKKSPGWAKSWEWSDDGTVISMELRDDLQWEDGTPLTVHDMAFAYELVSDPAVGSPRTNHVEHMKEGMRPKIIDDTHIEWHFTHAFDRDTMMAHTALGAVPKHVFGDADRATLRGNENTNKPLSYGPFRFANWKPNESFVLEPNPNFTGPEGYKPKLNRVIFRIIPEYSTRLIELESGKVDMMEQILVEDADRLREEHPEIRLVRRGWRSMDYVAWNLKNPLFEDVKVRRALALAVDVDGMIDKLLTSKTGESYGRRSIGTITPALCGVHHNDLAPIRQNVEKAKQLLAQAGWKDTDGDGVLDKDGKKFSFTLSTNTGNKRRANTAVLIQAQLKEIGVEVNLDQAESNTFFQNLRKRDYEAALAGWSAALFVDPSSFWGCDKPEQKNEFNFTGYCDEEVEALLDKGLSTPNPKDAAPIWKELQEKVYEDQPYLFLWWQDEIVGIHERFENTTIDVLSNFNNLHEWEVPPDKVKYKK